MKFNMQKFIEDCQAALEQPEPAKVVKQLVQDAIADPEALRAAFEARGKPKTLRDAAIYRSETLSILDVTTPPGMVSPAHDHQMWAVIGVYDGAEPNEFFVGDDKGVARKSGKLLQTGDVAVLGDKTIHAISNPLDRKSYAIHVYGGDIVERPGRSMWSPHTQVRENYNMEQLTQYSKDMRDIPADKHWQ